MNKAIRVMIIDDSAVVRQVMSDLLGGQPDIRVIGTACDPLFAMQRMHKEWPDVITLDVEMPRMDGITFLKQLMAERPTPVVMCSSLTEAGAATTAQALAAGAVAVIAKPALGVRAFLEDAACDLANAVRGAARANLRALAAAVNPPPPKPRGLPPAPLDGTAMAQTTERVVAIGTSTGGTMALERLLSELPRVAPGMVIVQHMPEKFTASFAERLNSVCEVEVLEARDGMRLIPGRVLIAPGGRHLSLQRSGAQYQAMVRDGPPINRHRPSVDVLFRSVARCAGANAVGVIMTGMGSDGACGLKEMHDAGARTLAQDEASSVVYGMPKEAVKLGAVDRSLPLGALAGAILSECTRRSA